MKEMTSTTHDDAAAPFDNPAQSPPLEDSSKSSSVAPVEDLEKRRLSDVKEGAEIGPDAGFERPVKGFRWFLVCVGLYLGAVLYGLDTTIAADVQGPILASLGSIEKLAWVGIGFPMGSVAVILLIGTCYGLFEIKYFIISSIVLFEIGSAICGAAPTMDAIIVGRVIAGIGGAGMYLGLLNYISVFTTLKERPIYNALIGLCWGTGCILGPIVGGAFSGSSATWRWAFYINLVLAGITCPIYFILFPRHNPQPSVSTKAKLLSIDWIGAVLNASTFVLFMVTLTFAGSTWAWNSPTIIVLWVVFGVSLIAFIAQSYFSFFTKKPLYPVQFLKRRTMLLLYFATASSATALAVTVYYIPLFFQFTKGDSAIQAAVRLLPFIAVNIGFTMFSGALLPIFGRYQLWYIPGGIFVLIGGSLMYTITGASSTATIYGYEILIAVGSGVMGQIGYSVAAVKVKHPSEVPAAIGFMNVAQIGSIAIALTIAGAIFQNVGFVNLRDALQDYGFTDEELKAALAGAQSAILAHSDGQVVELAIGAIVKTISRIFALVIAAGALALVSGVLMRTENLDLRPVAAA